MEKLNPLLKLPNNNGEIFWRRLTMDDIHVVEEMLLDHYVKYNDLSAVLTREEADAGLVGYAKACLKDGNSICAYDPITNRVCGISINSGPHTINKYTDWSEETQLPLKMAQAFKLVSFISKGPENALASRAGIEKFVKCELLSVHGDFIRQGIGEALCKKLWEIARAGGCKFCFAECTSSFTVKIFNKNGGECLREVPYSEYVDPISGKKIYQNMPEPHNIGTLMCKKL